MDNTDELNDFFEKLYELAAERFEIARENYKIMQANIPELIEQFKKGILGIPFNEIDLLVKTSQKELSDSVKDLVKKSRNLHELQS